MYYADVANIYTILTFKKKIYVRGLYRGEKEEEISRSTFIYLLTRPPMPTRVGAGTG